MRRLSVADFWSRVQRGEAADCWPWTGARTGGGYGAACIAGRSTTAHRLAFEFSGGKLQPLQVVMHSCDNPPCCNPAHLRAATQRQNLADMHSKGRAGDCRTFGEAHGMAKLTAEQVVRLRTIYAAGTYSQTALARLFGVSQAQVGRIVRGENRKAA